MFGIRLLSVCLHHCHSTILVLNAVHRHEMSCHAMKKSWSRHFGHSTRWIWGLHPKQAAHLQHEQSGANFTSRCAWRWCDQMGCRWALVKHEKIPCKKVHNHIKHTVLVLPKKTTGDKNSELRRSALRCLVFMLRPCPEINRRNEKPPKQRSAWHAQQKVRQHHKCAKLLDDMDTIGFGKFVAQKS